MAYHTKQQKLILDYLQSQPEAAVTAAQVAEHLKQEGTAVGLATVYRQLERLAESGAAHKINTEEGALFQVCPHPNDHQSCFLLRCQRCRTVTHLDCGHLQELAEHLLAEHGFRMDPRLTVLSGLCRSCLENRDLFAEELANGAN